MKKDFIMHEKNYQSAITFFSGLCHFTSPYRPQVVKCPEEEAHLFKSLTLWHIAQQLKALQYHNRCKFLKTGLDTSRKVSDSSAHRNPIDTTKLLSCFD